MPSFFPAIRPSAISAVATAAFLTCFSSHAAPLKVDISNSGRPLTEGLDPAFTDWATTQNWFTGGNTTSRSFSGVTVKFTRVGSVGTALKTGYWKTGVQSTAYNVKLTADGIKVDTPDATAEAAGSQIEMRLTGLSAGAHTLLLYLNNWDGGSTAPLDILVNGTQVVDNLPVSTQVTDNNNATTSYLNLTAVAGQDVVVLIKAETSGSQTSKNVHINGFEIDTPNAKAQANNPLPDNADEHVNADSGSLTLGWTTAVLGAASHNVYFGTSSSAVDNATTASPEYKGNQTTNTYPVSGLNVHLTYYWRVDEVASGGAVTKGNVWYFRPRRLAFPGAEGYGRFARGGRGGVVVHVTNLNDSGPGSLRDAILGNYGPRTVVFDVSGLITLNDDIIIDGALPYITVAGQTAPGKGICIKNQQFAMSGGRDVIFRYVRGLVGKDSGETQNATGMAGCDHTIMDHCTFGWGIDEGLSTRGGKNLTFQRCSLSEALNVAGHQNYPAGTAHGYAASIGGDKGSFHHNLLAHNEGRNWSLAGGLDAAGFYSGRLDIFNNVVYNWGGRATDGGAHEVNFVNNYYRSGGATSQFKILKPQYGGFPGMQQYYMAGNVLPGKFTASAADQLKGLELATESGGTLPANSTPPYSATVAAPFWPSYAMIDTAQNAFKKVLSDVGCNLPQIDTHDTRVITESLNGTYSVTGSVSGKKGLPDKTSDLGGWENYGTAARPANWDTDKDGMPDWWESLKGLNTASPAGDFSESNGDPDADGYTSLEEYLNWMAAPNADCATTVDVDLAKLSRGYTSTPVYTLSGPVNGTVAIVNTNKARFTATNPNTAAVGGFTFTVTDSTGDSMTQTIGVRILGPGGIPAQALPTGLTATVSGTQVSLSWTASPGATSYKLKRSSISGDSSPVTIATPAGTSQINTGLANGTYYYLVSAIGTGGESGDTAQVSATITAGTPVAPTSLTATAGNAQVSLSWSAVSGATSYNVKRGTVSGGPYTTVASPTSASYLDTGLTNGTAYYYVVSAVNGGGEGTYSSQASATPLQPSAPTAPTGLSATAGNTQVSLSWTAVSGATSYNVKRATTTGGPYTTVASPTSASYTNTGLANGTAYYYVVTAVNSVGESANSSQAAATPQLPAAPSAPTGLSATAGNTQVSLSWTAVSGATSYNVKRATTTGGPYTTVVSPTGTTYTNTGLTNGTTYYYVVSTVNSGGESANSSQASATPAVGAVSPALAYAGYAEGSTGTAIANDTVSGGTGWTGNYGVKPTSSTYPFPYYTNGLTYSDGTRTLVTAGSAVRIGADVQVSTNTQQYLVQHVLPPTPTSTSTLGTMATSGGGTTGTLWISFLYYNPSYTSPSGFYREATLNFVSGSPTSGNTMNGGSVQGGIGMPNTSASVNPNWTSFTSRTDNGQTVASTQSSLSAFSATTQLVVLRMDIDTTTATTLDKIYVWVNPSLGSEPNINTALLTNTTTNLDPINAFRWIGNGYSGTTPGATYTTDELRLGKTFTDVTPLVAAALPEVTIEATGTFAGEYGADQSLAFTISRTGATTSALTVPLVASGSATSGADYSGFATSVIISIGQGSVVLPLTVLPDALAEGPETVTVSLGASANFTAGTPASDSATIDDKPSQAFYFGLVADPDKRGPLADSDDDSSANIIEYFMGTHPGDPASHGALEIQPTGTNTFKVRYPRALDRADVSGSLRWSPDLTNWFAGGQSDGTRTVTFTEAVVSDPDANPETVEATATITGPGEAPKIFIRLGVQ